MNDQLKIGDVVKYKGGNTYYLIIEVREDKGLNVVYYKHPNGNIYNKKEFELQKQTSKVDITPEEFSILKADYKEYPDYLSQKGKLLQNTREQVDNWICDENFCYENKDFFLELFATHYPFTESQLKKYINVLPLGTEYTSTDERVPFNITGLIYNKNIIWTESLRKIFYHPSELIDVGETSDIYSLETDFNRYPITYDDNLNHYKDFEINRALKCCSNAEEMTQCDDSITAKYEDLRVKVEKSYSFNNDELKVIITGFNLLMASYEHFYTQIMSMIEKMTSNFNMDNFLEEILRYEKNDSKS